MSHLDQFSLSPDKHHLDLDPDVLFQGLERGLQMNRNLIGDWDLFVDAAVPLEELRTRYGIPPRQ